jgi:hypothetical protein
MSVAAMGLEVMDMKRMMTFACGLLLISACSNASTAQGAASTDALVAKPVATSGAEAASAPARPAGEPAAAGQPSTAGGAIKKALGITPAYRDVTLPAGTVLPVALETSVGSDISRVEQPVSGRLRRAVTVGGAEVLPAGTVVSGHVTAAQRPGKVKGRGLIAMRFTQLDTPGAGTTRISTATISRIAPATKKKDAMQIGAPAAAGAIIGGIVGGKGGAGKGAVIGGGAGTGYVLATRGKEVRLGQGASLAVRLTAPVTVRVPTR